MTIAKLLAVQIVISVFMVGVYMLIISLGGKISPMPFLKKSPVLLPAAFATGSSIAVMPAMMNLCIEKLGVSPKISSFAVPLAVLLNLVSACIYLSSTVIMLLKMYGVEVDLHTLLLVAVLTMMMSLGVPAIPSALVICTVTIAAMFGVPGAAAGLVFCIDAFSDRICTCLNVLGDTAVAVFLGRTENLLDEKIYFEN